MSACALDDGHAPNLVGMSRNWCLFQIETGFGVEWLPWNRFFVALHELVRTAF